MRGKEFNSVIIDDMLEAKAETEPTQEQEGEWLDNRLINGMAGEIVEKVKGYLKKNNIEEQGVDVDIEVERDQKNSFLIEVKTTIYKEVK